MKCEVCRKPSGIYPLCKYCFQRKENNEIAKCYKCNEWYFTDTGCVQCKGIKTYCEVCGKPASNYPLCKNCIKLYENNKIERCQKCNNWHFLEKNCKCNKQKCIKCGEPNDGSYLLCKNCCNDETSNKIIQNNFDFDYSDYRKKYPATIRSANGIYVRSLSEKIIADWFTHKKIQFEYEKMVLLLDTTKQHYCDFYLNDYNIYIEYWGLEKESYIKHKNYKISLYNQCEKYIVENLDTKHMANIDDVLEMIIHKHAKK